MGRDQGRFVTGGLRGGRQSLSTLMGYGIVHAVSESQAGDLWCPGSEQDPETVLAAGDRHAVLGLRADRAERRHLTSRPVVPDFSARRGGWHRTQVEYCSHDGLSYKMTYRSFVVDYEGQRQQARNRHGLGRRARQTSARSMNPDPASSPYPQLEHR